MQVLCFWKGMRKEIKGGDYKTSRNTLWAIWTLVTMVSGGNKDYYSFAIVDVFLVNWVYVLCKWTLLFGYIISFNIGRYFHVCLTDGVTSFEKQHGQGILANRLCNWDSSSANSSLEFLPFYYSASSLNLVVHV